MSTVYLVRHGQAGTRDAYDSLSELGLRQARLLGEYFASQNLKLKAVTAGSLRRQQQTARAAGFNEIQTDADWDEFDLSRVYREIAPQLCEDDAEFAREYAAMKDRIRASAGAAEASVHRQWQPCDVKVVQAWMSGRYPEEGEGWEQFRGRIAACFDKIKQLPDDWHVAIFTSATPIGIWAALAMDIFDQRSLRLAGVVHNTAYTVFRARESMLRLFAFNATPHLADPALRTHR